jgi:hypothetical protein
LHELRNPGVLYRFDQGISPATIVGSCLPGSCIPKLSIHTDSSEADMFVSNPTKGDQFETEHIATAMNQRFAIHQQQLFIRLLFLSTVY